MSQSNRWNRGLVLVELLIALVVIGVLAGIAIPRLTGAKTRAHDAAAISDMRSVQRYVQEYESNHMAYPATMEATGFEPSEGIEFTTWELATANGTPYLLFEAGHQDSKYIYYTAYPLGNIQKRERGEAPDFAWLNSGDNVAH